MKTNPLTETLREIAAPTSARKTDLLSALRQTVQMLEIYRREVSIRIAHGQIKNCPTFTVADINAAEVIDDARAAIARATGGSVK